MTVYGYVRVSSESQNEGRQVKKMLGLGIVEENIFIDKASGKNLDRPEYQRLMGIIGPGDQIILDSLDRLGRSYADVTSEWRRITAMGCDIRCLDLEFFDSRKLREMGAIGVCVEDMLLSLLSYVAQTEREKIKQRQAEGIALAKDRGKYKGRQNKEFDSDTLQAAQNALRLRGKAAAAQVLGVDRTTVYRMIKEGRLISAA